MINTISLHNPPTFNADSLEGLIQAEPPTSADDKFHLLISTPSYLCIRDVKRLKIAIHLLYSGSDFALPAQDVWIHADPRLPVQVESQLLTIKPNGSVEISINPNAQGVGGIYAVLGQKENKAYNSVLYTRSNILVYLSRRIDIL